MKNELLENNATPVAIALIDRRPRQTRVAAPDVFRRQESFWKEVRKRIVEKNPAFVKVGERLY